MIQITQRGKNNATMEVAPGAGGVGGITSNMARVDDGVGR
jgi:hypothetical protein